MPYFKNKDTGDVFEVSQEHADNVLRPQGAYVEVEKPVESKKPAKKDKE